MTDPRPRRTSVGLRAAGGLAAALILGLAPAARATPHPGGFPGDFGRRAEADGSACYVTDFGGGFAFDRGARPPVLRFDGRAEVWALRAAHGPRGDVIYFNDLGAPLVRATRLGGVTVFTPDHPTGAAAAATGPCPSPQPVLANPRQLRARLLDVGARLSRLAGRSIPIAASGIDDASAGPLADAAVVAAEALTGLAGRAGGMSVLARIARIDLATGAVADASLRGGALRITVAPAEGLAGRPSSQRLLSEVGAPSSP